MGAFQPDAVEVRRIEDHEPVFFQFVALDDGFALNCLGRWPPTDALRRAILVDNAARLYDYP